MINCLECGKETNNPKFCSCNCSGKYNNKQRLKNNPLSFRQKTKKCANCDTLIYNSKKYCKDCYCVRGFNADITLGEAIYTKHHRSNAYSLVRSRARTLAIKLGMNTCDNCGYNKHVEISHKKPIYTFSEDTLVSIINDPSNLKPLCPNCHWEEDHKEKVNYRKHRKL